ncbi:30S ribosomal protein S1 [Allofrancisella guangzhouensis]|uniref:Small ribosomal subunit protein bS1 n=1 Tax=Allofrancisella guangzhouensis TaxID=594679 RepID=A0A0A8E3C0_9GAMM|nr:30S ribosomal protein S1 [Allofrancisella guangzhouensis]AJC48459.1 30S ribosomal protein S1 [Allofrancisella guangzhouensis]MBK2027639.1 30S ribosomal protein S1 [Allofrancisella guangzhouensis]MBK2044033.1 30S ribosomal protein S1 [Allofrancisella guangzhouensis]MBK2046496.1 30S ribosomal protein S1 [Allofrancisella guangzhouensis]
MSENFKELFEQSLKQTEMRIGKIIEATVVSIDKEYAMIDAGLKSESFIPVSSLKNSSGEIEVAPGDKINVVLEALDNSCGETRLSRDKAKKIELWDRIEKAFESNETVLGRITNHVRGGYTMDVEGLRAFLPGSLVDTRPIKDIAHLEDKDIELKVVKIDTKRNNIVVSRKAVIEESSSGDRDAMLEKISEGSVLKGIVKNITDFGAFIDLGGVDGLLHITDISWSRISHPTDVLSIGQEIDVKIIKFDKEKQRISLGIKQLGEDPWLNIAKELPVGAKLAGNITNITDYGCFVKLKEGIEGLVHTSEMDWTNKNVNPHKAVSIGQEVEVIVLELDADNHRISLGIKQCKPNPWSEFEKNYKPGDKVTGKIRSITEFGVFIGLEGGIDGLVHISDVAWDNPAKAIKELKKGDEVEAVLVSVNTDLERIALSMKQLSEDPFKNFVSLHPKGSLVKGKVTKVQENGAVVMLDENNNIDGFIRIAEVSVDHTKDVRDELSEGQEVESRIINIDTKKRSIALSIKAVEEDASANKSNYKVEQMTPTTLGDLIKEQLNKK